MDPIEVHERKVARIAAELRRHDAQQPVVFRKRAVSHQVPRRESRRKGTSTVDVSDLDAILRVVPEERLCVAEPGVTFEDLCRATLKHGLLPGVVPELRTITIGGAVSGCSIESTSWKQGGFHDTCREYEIVTAAGDVLRCRPDNENELLFQMMHGSYGTLGLLSKLTFDLVPASPYVHVLYEKHDRLDAYLASIRRHFDAEDVDFMDGILHAPDELVLSVGRFASSAPYTNRYDWTKVYYRSTLERADDYLETEAYLFRYDRGVTNVHPKSAAGRLLFGKLLTSSRLLRLAEWFPRLLPEKPEVTLDVFVPVSSVPAFMEWYERAIGFFPVWCVPYRRVRDYAWLAPSFYRNLEDGLFLDLAIYGLRQPEGRNLYKEIEEALLRVHGIKTLISHNYYDASTFWHIYNRANYLAAKSRVDPAGVFGDLYEKTCGKDRGRGAAGSGAVLGEGALGAVRDHAR
jgi:FAD/FMN-containing dehydrogenase